MSNEIDYKLILLFDLFIVILIVYTLSNRSGGKLFSFFV